MKKPLSKSLNKSQLLAVGLALVVLLGLGLLLSRQVFDFGGLAFEILTYALSVVALVLAVLSVVNGIRQGRVMRSIVYDVHIELKQIATLNAKIEQEIQEDHKMNAVVKDILSRYDIDETEKLHKTVARRTRKRIQKHGL